jgi:hypothetical protein
MPSVTARSLGGIMWCLPLVLQPSMTLASEQQAKASSEQQTTNPNAPPAFNESAQPPGAQPRDGSPGKQPLASPSVAVSPKEKAWHTLQTACTGDKAADRANATRVLGLIRNDVKATKLAEKALSDPKPSDPKPEVRAAAAAALGDMNSRRSIPKLKKALDDENPSVALAAAHSLHLMRNNSAYEVYSEILAKQRKGGKGLISSQMSTFSDPRRWRSWVLKKVLASFRSRVSGGKRSRRSGRTIPLPGAQRPLRCWPMIPIRPRPKCWRRRLATKAG